MKLLMRATIGLLSLALSACASNIKVTELSSEEKTYLDSVLRAKPTFSVDRKDAKAALGRGRSFIKRYSIMRIRSSTDDLIATHDPNATEGGTIGYEITKQVNGNTIAFSVKCLNKTMNVHYTSQLCRLNEKLLAHYMRTGELNQKFINAQLVPRSRALNRLDQLFDFKFRVSGVNEVERSSKNAERI